MATWCKCGRKLGNPVEERLLVCGVCEMNRRNATVAQPIHVSKTGKVTNIVTRTIRERKGEHMAKQAKATTTDTVTISKADLARMIADAVKGAKTTKAADTGPAYDDKVGKREAVAVVKALKAHKIAVNAPEPFPDHVEGYLGGVYGVTHKKGVCDIVIVRAPGTVAKSSK